MLRFVLDCLSLTRRPLGSLSLLLGCLTTVAVGLVPQNSWAASVAIVVAPDAPPLEKFAASELSNQLSRLFQADVSLLAPNQESQADLHILLGSPNTNSSVAKWRTKWPEMSEQGHLIREIAEQPRPTLIVGGNTPVATLWAVYELGNHWGVRYFLFGDLDPVAPRPLSFQELDRVIDPAPSTRGWTLWDDAATGWQGWGLADQRALIGQLAKLKFNHVVLRPRPWQPFIDFQFAEVPKRSAHLWDGTEFIVSGDTAGRSVFRGAQRFDNPDVADKTDYGKRIEAGTKLLSGVIGAAQEHGLQATMVLSPGVFAKEFANSISPPLVKTPLSPGVVPAKSDDFRVDDPKLIALVKKHLEAYRQFYPHADHWELSVEDFRDWPLSLDQALVNWTKPLSEEERQAWDRALETARQRNDAAELDDWRTILTALTLIRSLGDEAGERPGARESSPATGSWRLADVPWRLRRQLGTLQLPTDRWHYAFGMTEPNPESAGTTETTPSTASADLSLAASRPSVLPELDEERLTRRLESILTAGLSGYRVHSWEVGDLDLPAHRLSRLASGQRLSGDEALIDLLEPVCGEEVAERVITAFAEMRTASQLLAEKDRDLGNPRAEMLLRYYRSVEGDSECWGQMRDHYLNAMNEMYRANTRARQGGRVYTLYLARRFEFAFEYMNCLLALQAASAAGEDEDERLAELEKAIESLYGGLNALSAVARSPSDLGIIAVLNAYGYRPLLEAMDE